MSGTSEGGKKVVAKVRQKYGADAYAKWGSVGHTVRKVNTGGLDNPDRAMEIAAKGGAAGHRARRITIDDKLRPDEWGILLKVINLTAGKIRLEEGEESMSAVDQHLIYHKVFEYWGKEDWVGAMLNICDHPSWNEMFVSLLDEANVYYRDQIARTPRGSEERNLARIYRNLIAAYQVAQRAQYEKENG